MRKRLWRKTTKAINNCYGDGAGETVRDMWIHDHPAYPGWVVGVAVGVFVCTLFATYLTRGYLTGGPVFAAYMASLWVINRWIVVLCNDGGHRVLYQGRFQNWRQYSGWGNDPCEVIAEVARLKGAELTETTLQAAEKVGGSIIRVSDTGAVGCAAQKVVTRAGWSSRWGTRKQSTEKYVKEHYEPQNAYLVPAVQHMWETHPQDFRYEPWMGWPDALEACLTGMGDRQIGQVAAGLAETVTADDARQNNVCLGDLIETAQMVVA